jgi:hypothetical protein
MHSHSCDENLNRRVIVPTGVHLMAAARLCTDASVYMAAAAVQLFF